MLGELPTHNAQESFESPIALEPGLDNYVTLISSVFGSEEFRSGADIGYRLLGQNAREELINQPVSDTILRESIERINQEMRVRGIGHTLPWTKEDMRSILGLLPHIKSPEMETLNHVFKDYRNRDYFLGAREVLRVKELSALEGKSKRRKPTPLADRIKRKLRLAS